jgi:hypothetical protein
VDGRLRLYHRIMSVAVALAVPMVIYLLNGTIEPWAFVLGAVIGFSYWYFRAWLPPFLV